VWSAWAIFKRTSDVYNTDGRQKGVLAWFVTVTVTSVSVGRERDKTGQVTCSRYTCPLLGTVHLKKRVDGR